MEGITEIALKILKSLSTPVQILLILAVLVWGVYYIKLEMAEKPILKEILKEEIRIENKLAKLEEEYYMTHAVLESHIQYHLWYFYLIEGDLDIAKKTFLKDNCTSKVYDYFDIKTDCRSLRRKGVF